MMRRLLTAILLSLAASSALAGQASVPGLSSAGPSSLDAMVLSGCGSLTTNALLLWTGTVCASSSVTDNGTAVLTAEPLSLSNHLWASGTAPALTSCGTSPAISGSDLAGQVTMGTGSPTGCTITFHAAYTSTPYCTVTWQSILASEGYSVSTTAITLTQTGTSSDIVNYTCMARSGG
jgi:hypothetical protein